MPDSTTLLTPAISLFISAFTSATLLPGTSETVFALVLSSHPGHVWLWLLIATVGNTLGGITSYWMGRMVPRREGRWIPRLQRYGTPALLLSWVPIIGDAICLAAGTLRLPWIGCLVWMAVGKFGRYLALVYVAQWTFKLIDW